MDFTTGTIAAISDRSITIKSDEGSEKTVALADSTKYSKITESTSDGLAVSKKVMVIGQSNADGSITARSIQIRPELPSIPKQNQLRTTTPGNVSSPKENQGSGFQRPVGGHMDFD